MFSNVLYCINISIPTSIFPYVMCCSNASIHAFSPCFVLEDCIYSLRHFFQKFYVAGAYLLNKACFQMTCVVVMYLFITEFFHMFFAAGEYFLNKAFFPMYCVAVMYLFINHYAAGG